MKLFILVAPLVVLSSLVLGQAVANSQTSQPSIRIPVQDNTLGTQVTGTGNFDITGGMSRGGNLFHSFQDFSVPTDGSANFVNPVGNKSIITRVTGSLFSDINGAINTNGANFFLINPNGVVFGPGAKLLNVGSIFATSTANSLDLADGKGGLVTFGTTPGGDAPFLAINPNALFNVSRFNLGGGSGEIKNYGVLQTAQNQYIGLIGGNVSIDGGKVIAPGGRVELGGLSAPGAVEFADSKVGFPAGVARSDVSITNSSVVSVSSVGGGDITVNAKDIKVQGESSLVSGVFGIGIQTAGDIKLDATNTILVDSGSSILNAISDSSIGKSGLIDVRAGNSIFLNKGKIASEIARTGKEIGSGGRVSISTGKQLLLENLSTISASTFGDGSAGTVTVKATDGIILNSSNISSNIEAGMNTNNIEAGIVDISAKSLSLQNGGRIETVNRGSRKGKAGDIIIDVTEAINIDGGNLIEENLLTGRRFFLSGIFSSVDTGSQGNAGTINIKTGSLSLINTDPSPNTDLFPIKDNVLISAGTSGIGQAGIVMVNAKDAITLNAANIVSNIRAGGDSSDSLSDGTVNILARSLSLMNGARIQTTTDAKGKGNAGNIIIKVTEALDVAGKEVVRKESVVSGISSSIGADVMGNGGSINIDTGSLSLRNSSSIAATTNGIGSAGNITVKAKDAIILDISNISTNIGAGGNSTNSMSKGGVVDISANSLTLRNGSRIQTSTDKESKLPNFFFPPGVGNAGDVYIKVDGALEVVGAIPGGFFSGILSSIEDGARGDGGNITVKSSSLSIRDTAVVTASNDGIKGMAGNIEIVSPKITLDNSGKIESRSSAGSGGNINIDINNNLIGSNRFLVLRRGSRVSTDSKGSSGSNGGNINIGSNFIVSIPRENSDITADATRGNGGNVLINAQGGIFGIQNQPRKTDNSDITASSDFGRTGNVSTNTPGVDPGKNIGELPAVPTDASKQISQACTTNQLDNKFVVAGRGGHPPNTDGQLTSEAYWQDARDSKKASDSVATAPPTEPVKPAVSWVFDKQGNVTLLAHNSTTETTRLKITCPINPKVLAGGTQRQ